ncbi:DsbA family oxidoreductase [Cellulomonas soli]|uniref:DsbA family oxidoreductase n=1 Tax=Cellulomonas soli TaxID=931535 RepID=UPI003F85B377
MTTDTPTPASPQATLPIAAPHRLAVEIWSDVACPWCFIGKRRFAAALAEFPHREHVDVRWRAYELSPDAPHGPGIPELEALARAKGLPTDQVRQMFAHVTAVAAGDGLAYDFDRTLSVNTFDLHRLVQIAREEGGASLAERTLETFFSAHFEHGADLGDRATVVALAAQAGFGEAGLDEDAVRDVLDGDRGAEQVRDDETQARALGVTGVPFFAVDRRIAVSGAQPVEVFTQLLHAAWTQANPLVTIVGDADGTCTDDSCAV